MGTFTLEELGAVVEKKFAPTVIDMGEAGKLIMRPVVNLSDDETAAMARAQREINSLQGGDEPVYYNEDGTVRPATDEESEAFEAEQAKIKPKMLAILHDMIRTAAGADGLVFADKFIALKGDQMGWLLALMGEYGQAAQLGEASASSSS